ncbi:MAG: PAS domain S-box protein [Magnetococcales bacterium]|nr:PAS domain S-box protein [Magnetococcales bacterium]
MATTKVDLVQRFASIPLPPFKRYGWLPLIVLAGMGLLGNEHLLIFHFLAEFVIILVWISMAVLAWNTFELSKNHFLAYLANGYFWVALLELPHVMGFKGMGIFPSTYGFIGSQFWVAARGFEALLLLTAPLFLTRPYRARTNLLFGGIAVILITLILAGKAPVTFVTGQGLTPFKLVSEYLCISLMLGAGGLLYLRRQWLDRYTMHRILWYIGLSSGAELAFTLYTTPTEMATVIGHLLKLVAVWQIFESINLAMLREPFRALGREASSFNAIPDAVILVDEKGLIRQTNTKAMQLVGLNEEALLGNACHPLFHPPFSEPDDCMLCRSIREGTALTGVEIELPQQNLWHSFSLAPVSVSGQQIGMIHVIQDITTRKQAEEALYQSEEMHRIILNSISDAVFLVDLEGRFLYICPNAHSIFGYSSDEIAALGRCQQLLGGELFEMAVPDKRKELSNLDWHINDRYGKHHHLLVNLKWVPIYGASFLITCRDVTERVQAMAELRAAETRFRQLFEVAPIPLYLANQQGALVDLNRRFEESFGYSRTEVPTLADWWQLACPDPDDRRRMMESWDDAVQQAKEKQVDIPAKAYQVTCKDGQERTLSISGVLIGTDLLATFFDDTERKRAKQLLMEEVDRRKILFERSRDGICVMEIDGRVREANATFAAMLGYSQEELEGLFIWDWDVLWSKEEILLGIANLTSDGINITTRHRRKDGSEYDAEVSTCRVEWQGTALIWSSVRDITPQLRQEAQLRQALKMEAIGTLAGGIAHDFNNLLGIILGYTELVLEKIPADDQRHQDLQDVFQAGKRAKELVAQLLTFSRMTEGKQKLIQVSPILKETIRFMRASLPTTIEINTHILDPEVTVQGDPTQLHQVVMNLCTNAGLAMEEKGGVMDVSLASVELSPEQAAGLSVTPGQYALLTVQDTGVGIPPDLRERMFDPFFTTRNVGRGTGLGLSVVHGIVADAKGAIQVTSEVNQGTAFQVYWPQAVVRAFPLETAETPLQPEKMCRVLFVDDEISIARLGKMQLETLGCQVEVFTNPHQAWKHFQENPVGFDLILSDQTMPGMTGTELLTRIRRMDATLPLVLCSGKKDPLLPQQLRALNIQVVLRKPILKDDLGRILHNLFHDQAR